MGNAAVQRMLAHDPVQRQAEDVAATGDHAVDEFADSETTGPELVAQTLRESVSVSRQQAVTVQRHPCPPYNGYSAPVPVESFNCAGLAHRTYDFKSLPDTKALLAGGQAIGGGAHCTAGQVKHWLWEYDLFLEDGLGRRRSQDSHDFHTVAGMAGAGGADPVDVYTKNGHRPIHGPGTGPGFRPPPRDRATSNDSHEAPASDANGNPLFKVRNNMVETCHCLACPSQNPPQQGPPPP